jgi:hypothetical protein
MPVEMSSARADCLSLLSRCMNLVPATPAGHFAPSANSFRARERKLSSFGNCSRNHRSSFGAHRPQSRSGNLTGNNCTRAIEAKED